MPRRLSTAAGSNAVADARLRSEWLTKLTFLDLSDTAWRVFTGALMWSVGNGTNGEIPKRYLRWLHPDGEATTANSEISAAGLWEESADAYTLIGWDTTLGQSTAEQVEKYREDARIRQQRRRQRAKSTSPAPSDPATNPTPQTPSITENVTRDVTANVGTARHGNGTATAKELGTDLEAKVNDDSAFEKYTDERGRTRTRRVA